MRLTSAFLFLAVLFSCTCSGFAQADREAQVKARYLASMARFVEWPENVFESPNSPFVIGVLGRYSFGISLADAATGKSVHGRSVQIRRKRVGEDLRDFQIVFVSNSEAARLGEILKTLSGAPVLFVGESNGFLEAGGTLNFVMEGERVRFDANLLAASRAGLQISSKLLMMARVVRLDSNVPRVSDLNCRRELFRNSLRAEACATATTSSIKLLRAKASHKTWDARQPREQEL